jgi:ribonuclease BN (tRNA processing enzyme)
VKLTILGCSGSGPSAKSPASGYLVESGDTRIVLDLGNGTFGALQRHVDPFAVDALFLTHLHVDHCADFGALTVMRRYRPGSPRHRLPVFAPEEAPSRLAALYAANEAERAEADLSDVHEFAPPPEEPVRVGPFEVRAVPVNHVCESWGLRVEAEGRVLAYTGDTGPSATLTDLARDADVVLCEASWEDFDDAPPDVHLSGTQAGEAATEAAARRLLLTHLQPWSDQSKVLAEARAVFGGPVQFVEAGQTYVV